MGILQKIDCYNGTTLYWLGEVIKQVCYVSKPSVHTNHGISVVLILHALRISLKTKHARVIGSRGHTRNEDLISSIWSESCKKLYCIYAKNDYQIRSQFCTGHDSSAVVTCAYLWSVHIVTIMMQTKGIFIRFQLSASKPLAKWITQNRGSKCHTDKLCVKFQFFHQQTWHWSSSQTLGPTGVNQVQLIQCWTKWPHYMR